MKSKQLSKEKKESILSWKNRKEKRYNDVISFQKARETEFEKIEFGKQIQISDKHAELKCKSPMVKLNKLTNTIQLLQKRATSERALNDKKEKQMISTLEAEFKQKRNQLQEKFDQQLKKLEAAFNQCPEKKKEDIKIKMEVLKKDFEVQSKVLHKLETKKRAKIDVKCHKLELKVDQLSQKFSRFKDRQIYKCKVVIARKNHSLRQVNERFDWKMLPREEQLEVLTKLSFYKPDTFGYWLLLLTIVFEIIYVIQALSVMPRDFLVGIAILFNIVVLLFLFTCALKVKAYSKKFSYASIGYGIYNILRIIVVVPFILNINYGEIGISNAMWIILCLVVSSAISILVGITSYGKIVRKEKYKADGKISFKQLSR